MFNRSNNNTNSASKPFGGSSSSSSSTNPFGGSSSSTNPFGANSSSNNSNSTNPFGANSSSTNPFGNSSNNSSSSNPFGGGSSSSTNPFGANSSSNSTSQYHQSFSPPLHYKKKQAPQNHLNDDDSSPFKHFHKSSQALHDPKQKYANVMAGQGPQQLPPHSTKKEHQEFKCRACNSVFGAYEDLQKHIRDENHFQTTVTSFDCRVCHRVFGTMNELKKHIYEENHHAALASTENNPQSSAVIGASSSASASASAVMGASSASPFAANQKSFKQKATFSSKHADKVTTAPAASSSSSSSSSSNQFQLAGKGNFQKSAVGSTLKQSKGASSQKLHLSTASTPLHVSSTQKQQQQQQKQQQQQPSHHHHAKQQPSKGTSLVSNNISQINRTSDYDNYDDDDDNDDNDNDNDDDNDEEEEEEDEGDDKHDGDGDDNNYIDDDDDQEYDDDDGDNNDDFDDDDGQYDDDDDGGDQEDDVVVDDDDENYNDVVNDGDDENPDDDDNDDDDDDDDEGNKGYKPGNYGVRGGSSSSSVQPSSVKAYPTTQARAVGASKDSAAPVYAGEDDDEARGAIVGTCEDMCPQAERLDRQSHSLRHVCEPSEDQMIKRYKRSAAATTLNIPRLVRTPLTLLKTCRYMEDCIVPVFETYQKPETRDKFKVELDASMTMTESYAIQLYKFIWDRYKTVSYTHLTLPTNREV